jgi:FAD/FMN-containing dehydrogenase
MTTSNAIVSRQLEALQTAITGEVFVAGEDGYDQARQAWNLTVDERPAIVVAAETAADVAQAVRFARSQGMRIAPQGTGHGSEPLEPLTGAMLLRTVRMRDVRVDPVAHTARAEAGTLWQDVTVPAAEHGLAALAGTSPNVGVTGYTLGGGIGWLARRYGLAANSVTAAEVVTPDGRLARTDAEHEPDLFWAVRGGGGSVGVVTALEMRLYPVRELYAGALFSRSSAPKRCCAPGARGPAPSLTRSPPSAASSVSRQFQKSPSRCAAGPSPWSRPPASPRRALAPT